MNKRRKGILLLILISCMLFIQFGLFHGALRDNENFNNYTYCIGKSNIKFINNQNLRENKYDINEFIQLICFIILYIIIMKIDEIKIKFIIENKHIKAEKLRKSLENHFVLYSQENLLNRIKEIISKMYEAFFSMDIVYVKDYFHTSTYEVYKSKIEWMKIRNENFSRSDIKLLKCKLVGLEHYNDISKDTVYFFMKLQLQKNINRDWRNINNNNNINKIFELWEFTIQENKWVLHKIIKINDFTDFMNIRIFSEK